MVWKGTPVYIRTLPRAGHTAKLSNQGRRALVRDVTKKSMATLTTAALHQSGLYGRVARRKPILSKRHITAHLEFAKGHLKTPRT